MRFLAGDAVSLCPSLIISRAEIDTLFERLGRALNRTRDWAKLQRSCDPGLVRHTHGATHNEATPNKYGAKHMAWRH